MGSVPDPKETTREYVRQGKRCRKSCGRREVIKHGNDQKIRSPNDQHNMRLPLQSRFLSLSQKYRPKRDGQTGRQGCNTKCGLVEAG